MSSDGARPLLQSHLPREWRQALGLLVATRAALCCLGVMSRLLLQPYQEGYVAHYQHSALLDIWGVWDTGWYMGIALHGYAATPHTTLGSLGQADVAFFPLYPLLARWVGWAIRSDYLGGLLVSNVCLIGASVLLYHLARLDHDEATSLRAMRYLFVFPMAFVLSGFLTESLFLFLILACLYCARRERWLLCGTFGLLAALTRCMGALLLVPALYEYLGSRSFQHRRARWDVLCLLLIPLGTWLFGAFCYRLTGDFLAFSHVQAAWGRHWANPVDVLWSSVCSGNVTDCFWGGFAWVFLLVLLEGVGRIRRSYWLFGVAMIVAPLTTGSAMSMPRFLVPVFPLYLVLAGVTENGRIHAALLVCLALTQMCLMVFWTNAFLITV
jgi:hypothetical protein